MALSPFILASGVMTTKGSRASVDFMSRPKIDLITHADSELEDKIWKKASESITTN